MRALVLGTSHALALRGAFPVVQAAHPGIELSFWGLPGACFHTASTGADGLLRPDPSDRTGQKQARTWNGSGAIDLARFDRIFLIGLRYGLQSILRLFCALQPAEWGRRPDARLVSERFLRAAIAARIGQTLREQAARTPLDTRFVFMPAPYPAAMATTATGPHADPTLRQAAGLPDARRSMALVEDVLAETHAAIGVGFAPQPRETLAAPLMTRDVYLDNPGRDARHMNSAYGQLALTDLLATQPAPHAAPRAATTA